VPAVIFVMNKKPVVIFGIFAAICVVLIPFWALDTKGKQSASPAPVASQDEAGQTLFQTNCGVCHTLAGGGTDGQVGPDLDTLLVPTPTTDPEGTFKGNYSRVLTAVTCGVNGRMPAGILQGAQAQEVATFVAAYAGQVGGSASGPLVDTATVKLPAAGPCPK
jgi:mono/diheme cytochrome c family protein